MSPFFEEVLKNDQQQKQQQQKDNYSNFLAKPPSCRTERFVNNSMITIVGDSRDSYQFSRQIATLKNVQTDNEPFYVMDVGKINALIDQWQIALPRVQPFYSLRCNNNLVLLKILADNPFVGFNCQSNDELQQALEIVSPQRIYYNNPCLTRTALRSACASEIPLIGFSSARDLTRILQNHPNAELILNISMNPDSDPEYPGCDISEAAELLRAAHEIGNCVGLAFDLRGARCNSSSSSVELYARAIENIGEIFEYGRQFGMSLKWLNIGGGFANNAKNFEQTCAQINDALDYYLPEKQFPNLRIVATPGRFFAASAFSLATKIMGRRSVDASMVTNDDFDTGNEAFIYQTNESYYGSFGCRIEAHCEPECSPLFENYLDKVSSQHMYASVVGPCAEEDPFDVLQALCRFRPCAVGEWLLWRNMGAYSLNNTTTLEDANINDSYGIKSVTTPSIFYFSSHDDWTRIELRNNNNKNLSTGAISPTPTDDVGSCGMADDNLSLPDSDDYNNEMNFSFSQHNNNNNEEEEEDDNENNKNPEYFWMFEWLLNE